MMMMTTTVLYSVYIIARHLNSYNNYMASTIIIYVLQTRQLVQGHTTNMGQTWYSNLCSLELKQAVLLTSKIHILVSADE